MDIVIVFSILNFVLLVIVTVWEVYRELIAGALKPRIDLLHRTQEVLTKKNMAYTHMCICTHQPEHSDSESNLKALIEFSVFNAELSGLTFAIGDKELVKILWCEDFKLSLRGEPKLEAGKLWQQSGMLHERISELLEDATLGGRIRLWFSKGRDKKRMKKEKMFKQLIGDIMSNE